MGLIILKEHKRKGRGGRTKFGYNNELLFQLYFKHKGNMHSLIKDIKNNDIEDVPRQSRTINRIAEENKYQQRFQKERLKIANQLKEKMRLSSEEIIGIARNGIIKYSKSLSNEKKYITGFELKVLYEMMKVELGEPTLITKNENTNEDTFLINITKEIEPEKLELDPKEPKRILPNENV